MKIALATCTTLPDPDPDGALLAGALSARGAEVRMLAWDGPEAHPAADELVVLRSTWNYHRDVERFVVWITQAGAGGRLLNPAPVVLGNLRKTYLRDLERAGVAIIPTEYVAHGEQRALGALMSERDWRKVVVKPVVSAGSFRTQCFGRDEIAEGQRFLDALAAERDAMIQRWVPSVETYGERSLVWIDGAFTHAIRKAPRFVDRAEAVSGELPIPDDERVFATKLLAELGDAARDLLYARVDIVRDEEGGAATLRLMELELVEPSLFLAQSPRALDAFADAIVRRAEKLA